LVKLEATRSGQRMLMDEMLKLVKETANTMGRIALSEKISILGNKLTTIVGSGIHGEPDEKYRDELSALDEIRERVMKGELGSPGAMNELQRIVERIFQLKGIPGESSGSVVGTLELFDIVEEQGADGMTVRFDPDLAEQAKDKDK